MLEIMKELDELSRKRPMEIIEKKKPAARLSNTSATSSLNSGSSLQVLSLI